MTNIKPELLQGLSALLERSKRIIVTNHTNPDGDAMGSVLGLAGLLEKLGHEVQVIVPNEYPEFLNWIHGNDKVLVYEQSIEQAENILAKAEVVFHLDYNALKRSGPMSDVLTACTATKVIIDHHQQPEDFADLLYSDTSMSSTCEMVYHLADAMGWTNHLSVELAEAIYTGLITDTGNFRFGSTSPATHAVASRLLERGVRPDKIAAAVYDVNTPSRLHLLGRALDNMELLSEYRTALIVLTEDDLDKFYKKKGDTEGFVNYGLSMQNVVFSVFAYPRDGLVKMSFRSKGDFDVNQFAREHFGGGGHKNAAGAAVQGKLQEAVKRFKEVLSGYFNELNHA